MCVRIGVVYSSNYFTVVDLNRKFVEGNDPEVDSSKVERDCLANVL
jgi:hypothetical protein